MSTLLPPGVAQDAQNWLDQSQDTTGRPAGKLSLVAQVGSKAYGTDHEDSDDDYKGIFIQPINQMLGLFPKHRGISVPGPDDTTLYELWHFAKLASQANPTVLEILYADTYEADERGELLREARDAFLSRRILQTYGGYAQGQLKKAQEGSGGQRGRAHYKRNKYRLHTLRLLEAGAFALTHGELMMRLPSTTVSRLRTVADLPDDVFSDAVESRYHAMKMAAHDSPLPDEPDYDRINQLIFDLRMQEVE